MADETTCETAYPSPHSGATDGVPGSWLSARIYEPFLWVAERSGMAELRRSVVAHARGCLCYRRTVERLRARGYAVSVSPGATA